MMRFFYQSRQPSSSLSGEAQSLSGTPSNEEFHGHICR